MLLTVAAGEFPKCGKLSDEHPTDENRNSDVAASRHGIRIMSNCSVREVT